MYSSVLLHQSATFASGLFQEDRVHDSQHKTCGGRPPVATQKQRISDFEPHSELSILTAVEVLQIWILIRLGYTDMVRLYLPKVGRVRMHEHL